MRPGGAAMEYHRLSAFPPWRFGGSLLCLGGGHYG
ncbi:uncharacterized protein METZ01_LOCUS44078 [marine metagenome]|uniref:Uncharacterized protein n=1 Tax=marine metagenome TaxID=408172 RepID=A0A381RJ12_9ZZZZ